MAPKKMSHSARVARDRFINPELAQIQDEVAIGEAEDRLSKLIFKAKTTKNRGGR